jgi:hypothetical protein
LAIGTELVEFLVNLQRQSRDNEWAAGQVKVIDQYLNRLRGLDSRLAALKPAKAEIAGDGELAKLTDDLKMKIIRAKDLITMFQIRLKGGRELIKKKLKIAAKGKGIRGYKPVTLRS